MKKPVEFRNFELKTDDGLKLHGRLPYNTESLDLGGFKERINPSAFKKSLQEREVKLLLNHNRENLLARTNNGSLRVYDTGDAIEWDATLVDIPENQSLWSKIASGLYNQISFGFRTIRDRWDSTHTHRELLECALEEFSIVDDGAYGAPATVSVRSLSEAFADKEINEEDKQSILDEISKLNSLLNPNPETEPPVEEPKEEPSGEVQEDSTPSEPEVEPPTQKEEPKEEDHHLEELIQKFMDRVDAVEKLLNEEERSLYR